MLNWISLICKMLFGFLRKVFGFADQGSRKRQLSEIDINTITDCTNPPKRVRSNHMKMYDVKDIIEIDSDDAVDDIIVCDDRPFNLPHCLKHRHTIASSSSNRCIGYPCINQAEYPQNKIGCTKYVCRNMGSLSGKSRLNSYCMPTNISRPSTLNKVYQLREKEEYSRLLQNFLPQPVQILNTKSEVQKRSGKPIETIDIENYEPSKSTKRSPEIYHTPKLETPTRWYTPMTKIPIKSTSTNRKLSLPEIIFIDADDKTPNQSHSESSNIGNGEVNRIEKMVTRSPPQIVPTNTLRDQLSAKDVLKEDYIPRVAERYNERMKQQFKAAQELKKMTNVLAKHNRLAREAALEIQLSRSMRLCEAVLEENDYLDDTTLPELTQSMLKQVKNALIPRPPDQVLVQSFGLKITRKDIHTLADLNWLNDEVINFYMNLLIARGGKDNFPRVYAMNTFFYPKLQSSGHASLKRWTRKIDIFSQDIVVIPIHLSMHWCMSIIDFRDKSIRYYDSMGGENPKCLLALRQYLEDESRDKKKQCYDTSDWTLESMNDIPQQMNGSDCGVFSCTFAEYICANKKLTFSQDDMPYFRNKMVYEILNVKLL